jgi:hypothetical protein
MATRSKSHSRRERDSDSMEALKPLVVLVLFGTILYGAYSVVQKGPGPSGDAAATTSVPAADAPPFAAAPQVELTAATPAPAPNFAPPPLAAEPAFVAQPAAVPAPPPIPAPPQPSTGQVPAAPANPANVVAPTTAAVAAAAVGAAAAAVPATADAAPTYLNAMSAAPPVADQVPATPIDPTARPDRYATLPGSAPPPAALPGPPPPAADTRAASASSTAFASAWADAHDKLATGRYAEALAALSVWYDDPSLGLEESQQLEDLLSRLAGTVIYSQQDLMLPPHVVAPGETLAAVAAPLGVSPHLLAKVNGIDDPARLVPGEHLKVIRGPFDAVVSISRRRLSLQLGGNYAGSFPVVIGRQFLSRVGGSLPVVEVGRDAAPAGTASLRRSIVLGEGLVIEAVDDPGVVSDNVPPSSLVLSVRDLDELLDILGPGSRVLVRQ